MGHRTLTTAGNIPKPIQTGFEMLARLGENRIEVSGPRPGGRIGIIATKSLQSEIQLIVYNYNETDDDFNISDSINIVLSGLENKNFTIEEYRLDREHNNTYREWIKQGAPEKSADANLLKLQQAGELSVTNLHKNVVMNGNMKLNFLLARHSMVLIKIKP